VWVFAALATLIAARVVQLQVSPDPRLQAAVGDPYATRVSVGRRGDIVDRRGRLLATSTLGWRAFIDPTQAEDLPTLSVRLQALIGLKAVDVDRRICARPKSRFIPVSGILESWQVDRLRSASLPGVGLEQRSVRVYPHGETAARLVGVVGFDHQGLGGMEHALERQLQGQPGALRFLHDVQRRPLWVDHESYQPQIDGAGVRLTIDLEIQRFVEQRLDAAVEKRHAGGGRIIVIDPASGEILAMADTINPRVGWAGQPEDLLRDKHDRLGRNRCVSDPYEPGSTFKPMVWAVATEHGIAHPDEVIPTPSGTPHRTASGRRIRDVHYYGPITWSRVLIKSVNSGMAIVAERMSTQLMQSVIDRFGFGRRTGCGIAGETAGLVTSPAKWTSYTQVSVSMGHEIAVTPLQMVRGIAAFARDGTVPSLRLLAETRTQASAVAQRAVSPETALQVRQLMRLVMTDGTGRASQSDRYRLFGKSGTAQMPKAQGGGYHEDRYISSFIAGGPLETPRVVVLCVIDDPDRSVGEWYGGRIAGPVVRDVIDFSLEYMGVEPDLPQDAMTAQVRPSR
jgi:cell division protein FtsI/penicillin-binding protein 2